MARDFLYRHVIPAARRLPAGIQGPLQRLWRAARPGVHARDEAALLDGRVTPTHMMAVARNEHDAPVLHRANLTPEFCVRQPALTS